MIEVGYYNGYSFDIIMTWTDVNFIKCEHVGLSTGYGISGSWYFYDYHVSTSTEYEYVPIDFDIYTYDFSWSVQAGHDVHIGLFPSSDFTNTQFMYEIVIGGWGGTQSVIRKGAQSANLVVYEH